jgi:MGT family glycosyltransferase
VLGIPHASVSVGLFRPLEAQKEMLAAALDGFRVDFGLPPDPGFEMLYRYLYLSFVPPSLQGPDNPLPTTARSVDPALFDQSGTETLPAWAEKLGARPVVYATMGTVVNSTPGVFATILEALRDEPIDIVVTVGRDQDPAELGPQPDNVYIERYIPQTLILPLCDAAVIHGGFNTTMAVLYHGLPALFIPVFADQPANAEKCVQIGVAESIPFRELSVEKVRSAVRTLLKEPHYREKALLLQKEMHALPRLDVAVDLLTALTK